jgi:hypothetical protein
MNGPGGLLLVVPHLFAVLGFSFICGVAKEYITKLGCEKYFHHGHMLSTAGDALRKVTISPSIIGVCSQLSHCRIPMDRE